MRKGQQDPLAGEAPEDLTVAGQWCPLPGVEGGLAAPQIFFTLGHQKRVTHMTVMKVLKQQPLGEGARYQGTEIGPHKTISGGGQGSQRPENIHYHWRSEVKKSISSHWGSEMVSHSH